MIDLDTYAVFRDNNSHCVLRVRDADHMVQYIAIVEEAGEMRIDLFKISDREFYHTYKELPDYPVRRAALHFAKPMTEAIRVTDKANKHLQSIIQEKHMSTATETNSTHSAGQGNVTAANRASVTTNNKVTDKPAVAPVKTKKPTAAEQKAAAKKIAQDKANAKAAEIAKKAKEKEEARDAAAKAKGKAPPKQVKAARVAKKAAKAKPKAKVPAKKVAKLVRSPKHDVATKKTVKKGAAKKAAKKEGGRSGRFDESMKIKILVKENPKREGTGAYDIFELLKKSATVGDFYKKGGGSHNLRWNIDHEYISVK